MEENNNQDGRIKYVVSGKKNSNIGKTVGVCILGFIFGLFGGISSWYLIDNIEKEDETDKQNGSNVVTTYSIESVENPVVAIAEKTTRSVVYIETSYVVSYQSLFGVSEQEALAQGTGIIYSADGYIVTNHHLVEAAVNNASASITVYLSDGKEYTAKILGVDSATDIAVLKIDATSLPAGEFGKSSELKVGELAVAIGSPLGKELASTVTVGYVSGLNRSMSVDANNFSLIQTDAAINSGNSGGPLVNALGYIIGINTAKISATGVEGIGFALPIDDVLPIVEEIIQNGKVVRPYIGIGGIALTEQLAKYNNLVKGIFVQQVEANSPAFIAGIKQGDVITEADGQIVTSVAELNEIKNSKKVGDKMTLKVYRSGQYLELTVVLMEAK